MRSRPPSWTRHACPAIAFAIAAVGIVSPIFETSFLGDDAFNSYLDGWRAMHHASLVGTIGAELGEWDIGRGRFIPLLQILNVLQFHVFHAPLPLKILQAATIGANVATLYFVVRAFGASAVRAAIACVAVLLTLQTRYAYDPISQYNLHLPLSTEAALITLFFAARFARTARGVDLGLAVAGYAVATLTYEIFAPLIVALPFVFRAGGASWAKACVRCGPFAILLGLEAVAVVVVRHVAPQPLGSAYSPALTGDYAGTVFRQVIGTLPFAYAVVDPQAVFREAGPLWILRATLGAIVAALALAIGILGVPSDRPKALAGAMFCAGLALLLGPASLVSASPFYQRTIALGTPYIPVFAQGFGLALCLAAFEWPTRTLPVTRTIRVVLACLGGFAAYALGTANEVAVEHFGAWRFPRQTIVEGFQHGGGRGLRAGDTVFLDSSYIVNDRYEIGSVWENVNFYRLWTGLPLRLLPNTREATYDGSAEAFDLRARHNTRDGGALVVARISRAGNRVSHIADATIVERFRSDAADSPRPLTVFGGFATRDFELVGRSETSATYSFQPRCRALSVDVAANDSPTRGSLVFGTGFSTEESDADRRWRWAGPFARLSVGNANATALDTELIASIGTVGAAKGTLAMSVRGTSRSQALDSHGRVLDLHVVVPPQSTLAVDFTATAPNVAIVGDARDLRFRLIDAHLQDAAGCAVADRR